MTFPSFMHWPHVQTNRLFINFYFYIYRFFILYGIIIHFDRSLHRFDIKRDACCSYFDGVVSTKTGKNKIIISKHDHCKALVSISVSICFCFCSVRVILMCSPDISDWHWSLIRGDLNFLARISQFSYQTEKLSRSNHSIVQIPMIYKW